MLSKLARKKRGKKIEFQAKNDIMAIDFAYDRALCEAIRNASLGI